MTLPPQASIDPKDVIVRASVTWGHTRLVVCPACLKPALVGWLDAKPVAYACHKCGPITPAPG